MSHFHRKALVLDADGVDRWVIRQKELLEGADKERFKLSRKRYVNTTFGRRQVRGKLEGVGRDWLRSLGTTKCATFSAFASGGQNRAVRRSICYVRLKPNYIEWGRQNEDD